MGRLIDKLTKNSGKKPIN